MSQIPHGWMSAIAFGLGGGVGGLALAAGRNRPDTDAPLTPEEEAARLALLGNFYARQARRLADESDDLRHEADRKAGDARMYGLEFQSVRSALAAVVARLPGRAVCPACKREIPRASLTGWGAERQTCADGAACLGAQMEARASAADASAGRGAAGSGPDPAGG